MTEPEPTTRRSAIGVLPEFMVVIAGRSRGGIAQLIAGAVAGALPGGWLDRTVGIRVGTVRDTTVPDGIAELVASVLNERGLPILPESDLTSELVATADLVLTADAATHHLIAQWPTASYLGESEPPEVFAAYDARVLGHDSLDRRLREARSIPDFNLGTRHPDISDALDAAGRPARFTANVIRAVVTNQGPRDLRFA